ncbi:MAG TPA: glycosyltransferase [Phycisphaerae bacterium]|nr:glycosyltransferase [Phycisphaerae bacterium]
MRIFIGLVEVAGYCTQLKRGFDELGVDATFVDLSGHPFRYGPAGRPGPAKRLLLGLRRWATARLGSKRFLRSLHRVFQTVVGIPLLVWGLFRYDVFIFGFGTSLCFYRELPILKRFGKTVIHVFLGSDVRPPYVNGAEAVEPDALSTKACIRAARRRKRMLRRIERYADALVDLPTQAQFHERPFVSWAFVGMPFAPPAPPEPAPAAPEAQPAEAAGPRPVRILHSPSNPLIKGTDRVRGIIADLRAKGHAIDYVEVSGKPQAVVLDELSRCDFIIDELYSDNLMAGLATEAAFFGKPSVVGGYAGEELERFFPPDRRPPVLNRHPDDVAQAVERLVTDEAFRLDLGRRASEFVRTRYAPAAVAAAYLRIIQGDVPPEWLCDPATIRHVRGMGLPEDRCRRLVREVIEAGGVGALQLADKPDLQRRFVEFAGLDAG